ncbi:MAG: glycosyltransferase family 4 protein [Pirellulales bacterium]
MSTAVKELQLGASHDDRPSLPAHVVVVTNFIASHRAPVYRELAQRVERLTILLSTPMEANRKWQPDWEGLNVVVQRTTTFPQMLRHKKGFDDLTYVHIPWDTVGQLRRLKPDVVLSAELGARTAMSSIYTTLNSRVPLVVWCGLSEHTEQSKGWVRHWLRRRLLPRTTAVVVNGTSGARYLTQLGVPDNKLHRIHYSCLPGLFDHGPTDRPEENTYRLFTVGQLIDRKGLLPLLQGLDRFARRHPERQVEWALAGSGPLEAELRAFPASQNLRIELTGHCNYQQLAAQYQRAGIFAFPSYSDDWGISVNEAMTSGLPVLGSVYAQSVDEMCEEGQTGWRFRTDMPAEIDRAVEAALTTPHDELNRMRRKARERVVEMTPGQGADDLVTALASALASRRKR